MVELYKGKNNKSYFVGDNKDEVLQFAKNKLKRSGIVVQQAYIQDNLLYFEHIKKADKVWVAYIGDKK